MIKSKIDIAVSYRLDLFVPKNNHAENFPYSNLADVLANPFDNLSPTSIDFRSFCAFPISISYLTTSDSTSGPKSLNSTSPGGPDTCNPGNILAFYHWLFTSFTIKPSTNVVSTDFSYLSSDSIEVEWENCSGCLPGVLSAFFWCINVCDSRNNDFLNEMYLLACAKYTFLYICNWHIYLLACLMYLVKALPEDLQCRIDKLYEYPLLYVHIMTSLRLFFTLFRNL